MRHNLSMRPHDIARAIENVLDEHPHGENITPLRKIERLLRPLRGFTSYTDEMVETVQRTSNTFYGRTDLDSLGSDRQYRYELLAAVHRLKNAISMMEDQLPKDIQVDIQ